MKRSLLPAHQTVFLERYPMLDKAAQDAVFLLNTGAAPDTAWHTLPRSMQQQIIDKNMQVYVIDAYRVATDSGMGRRINTIMQTCFFAISGVLPRDDAIEKIKQEVKNTYGRKGRRIVDMNNAAIDATLDHLHRIDIPDHTQQRV